MKKVLVIALFVTVATANSGWAQAPDTRPTPVQPGTLAILDTMAIVAKSQTVAPAPVPLLFLQAPAAPPAPARPATVPAVPAPARPAPGSAPPAAPATAAPLPPQAPPAAPAIAPAALPRYSPNVRFDVTITDLGGAKPVTKTLSLTIWAGNSNGSIRNNAQVPNPAPATGPGYVPTINIPLNVDVRNVTMVETGIRATVSVEYQPYVPEAKTQPGMVATNATTVFVDGRRTQILVTADPISDRKTTIEVTTTILK
jgi:hypothetical protein